MIFPINHEKNLDKFKNSSSPTNFKIPNISVSTFKTNRKLSPSQTLSNFTSRIQNQGLPHELNETWSKSKTRYKLSKPKDKTTDNFFVKTEPSLLNSFITPDKSKDGLSKFSLIYYPNESIDPSKNFNSFSEMLATNKNWTKDFNEPFSETHMVSQQLYHNVKQKTLIEKTHRTTFKDAYFSLFGTLTTLDVKKRQGNEKIKIYTNEKDKDMKAMLAVKRLIESSENEEGESLSELPSAKIKKKSGLEQLEHMNLHFKFYWYKVNNIEWRPENREGATLTLVNGKCYLYGGKARRLHEGIIELDTKKWGWQKIENFKNEQGFQARLGHTALPYKKQLLIYGGEHLYNSHLKVRDCLGDLRIIDFETKEIKTLRTYGDFIENRRNHGYCLFANKFLFIYGGINSNGRYLNDLMNLNLETAKWSICSSEGQIAEPIAFHTMIPIFRNENRNIYDLYKAFDLDYKSKVNNFSKIKEEGIYVFGGKDDQNNIYHKLRVLKLGCYPMRWSEPETKGEPPAARYLHSMNFFQDLNIIIIYGGRNDQLFDPIFSDICILNVFNLCWSKVTLFGLGNVPKCSHSSTIIGSKLVVFGGYTLQEYACSDLFFLELNQDLVKSLNDKNKFNLGDREVKEIEESDKIGANIVDNRKGDSEKFQRSFAKMRVTYLPIPMLGSDKITRSNRKKSTIMNLN